MYWHVDRESSQDRAGSGRDAHHFGPDAVQRNLSICPYPPQRGPIDSGVPCRAYRSDAFAGCLFRCAHRRTVLNQWLMLSPPGPNSLPWLASAHGFRNRVASGECPSMSTQLKRFGKLFVIKGEARAQFFRSNSKIPPQIVNDFRPLTPSVVLKKFLHSFRLLGSKSEPAFG